ncbi:MAG TPA: NADH-quinone oxidoreductase subunit M [Candidatus Acidoferrales bacterium]|nr:NADH-quinone oxidoreductase subunit M [Candidatus Acidoferrales bacterium]
MQQTYLLSVLTFLPLAGTLALLLLRDDDHLWIRRMAMTTAVVEFGLSLLLLRGFDLHAAGYQWEEFRAWIPQPPIHYHLGIDGLSLFLVLLTTLLTPISILASWKSIDQRVKGFFICLLVLETGVIGVFVSLDLFLFFLFWETMLIPMYFLIGIWGHGRRIYAALKFVLYTMFGSILMLVAMLWLYRLTAVAGYPTMDVAQIQSLLSSGTLSLPLTTEYWLFGAFFLAFAIKVPLFPLHTWLPDAHTEAPTAGSVMLAGVLLKMGIYGMLRFCLPLFPNAAHHFAPIIAVLAIIGIVYGALVAMVQVDLKRLVAYSSVSHLGFVVLGVFAFHAISIQGAVYQMLNHGISTGALFLCVGMLYDRRHTHLISEFGGLATPMPVLAAMYLFSCFASAGLPMLNNFVGEFLILAGTFQKHAGWAAWASIGVIFSAVYLLWSYQRVFFGNITKDKNAKLADLDTRERAILVVMAAFTLWMGIGSTFFTRRTESYTQNVLQLMQRPQAVNADGAPMPGTGTMDLHHAPATALGVNTAAIRGAEDSVKSK